MYVISRYTCIPIFCMMTDCNNNVFPTVFSLFVIDLESLIPRENVLRDFVFKLWIYSASGCMCVCNELCNSRAYNATKTRQRIKRTKNIHRPQTGGVFARKSAIYNAEIRNMLANPRLFNSTKKKTTYTLFPKPNMDVFFFE